ncbi:MAG: Rieske 2Fe-2S domain-containing protein [Sphingomonadaceae bacterium]
MTRFVDAGAADLAPGACELRAVEGQALIVARSSDGRWFATAATCSHALLSLEGGRVRGASIVCPHHGARFCLESGRVLGPPAIAPIAAYPTRVANGRVQVMLL